MGATPVDVARSFETQMAPAGLANQLADASAPREPPSGVSVDFFTDLMSTCEKVQSNPSRQTYPTSNAGQRVQAPTSPSGVSNCYVFKSLLQEYAQKVGLPTPVYETIKEGPSHEPSFKSTVIVGGVRYDSLLGFLNRKAAEQSAAEIALMELSKCGESKESNFVPVHETGLCKNLLQDYTQKMNYALPTYTCKRDDSPGKALPFTCTVEIGGIRYIGAAAKTKKEAEIKAARTALLAIRSSSSIGSENLSIQSQYTVVPPKRKEPEPDTTLSLATEKPKKKPKRSRFKKRRKNQQHQGNVDEQTQPESKDDLAVNDDIGIAVQQIQNGLSDDRVSDHMLTSLSLGSSVQGFSESSNINQHNVETSVTGGSVPRAAGFLQQSDINVNSVVSSNPPTDENGEPSVADVVSITTDYSPSQWMDASISDSGIGQGESDTNREPSVADNSSVGASPPASQQMDVSVSDPQISQGEPTLALSDTTNLQREENTAASNVAPVMSDPLSTRDQESLVSRIGQGEPGSTMADRNCEKEENTATNVACVISDPPPSQELDSSASKASTDLGEPAPTMEDPNQERL